MYSIGGWIASAGSCSKGLRSDPSDADGIRRANGLEVKSVNEMKPTLISPSTPSTRARNATGSPPDSAATSSVQVARIRIHSSSEPSCAPHTAATRYRSGSAEFELLAT